MPDDAPDNHPRLTSELFGHREVEQTLLDAYRSGRMPHALILGGPQGIGKATLAYRLARFVLAHPNAAAPDAVRATSLAVAENDPVARQVAAGTHGGLLTLERTQSDSGTLRTVITVDQVRETVGFFGSTAAAGGWRVCIVDSADDLKWPEAPNALLKILEEPPPRALFILVSHAPQRLLPTILSRCRRIMMRPLAQNDVKRALSEAMQGEADSHQIRAAAEASEGSVGRALGFLDGDALGLRQQINTQLASLPRLDFTALHALADKMGVADRAALRVFTDCIDRWIADRFHMAGSATNLTLLARLSEVWEKISRSAQDIEVLNLERKPLVFSAMQMLAEAMAPSRGRAA